MKLNENDYKNIAEQISEGKNNIEYEKDGETLVIECEYDVQGYVEDDYYRGTGAFVETDRTLSVNLCEAYDEDGNKTDCTLDETRLKRLVA